MSTFHIETQGCKVNLSESLTLAQRLTRRGYTPAAGAAEADLIVVNSCAVTGRADADARQLVHRLRRQNPRARLLFTGCLAELSPAEVAGWQADVEVVPNRQKGTLLTLLRASDPEPDGADGTLWDTPEAYPYFGAAGRTRAFFKVQDGCDACCSFCVIPTTRGPSRSLPLERVVAGVEGLVRQGAREIVLTGIHLGHYGRDRGGSLIELLDQLVTRVGSGRLRLTSIEPNQVSEGLVERMASGAFLAPHFHLPMQSGSDRILAAMRRPYTSAGYARTVRLVSRALPYGGIGADVIVGFPGESAEDFAATEALIRSLPLTYLHVFSYSARPGTGAARLPDRVPPAVIRERSLRLRGLAEELRRRFVERLVGRRETVLTMGRSPTGSGVDGLTGSFVPVHIASGSGRNQLVPVRMTGFSGAGAAAELVA